jgi:hypothetical protein
VTVEVLDERAAGEDVDRLQAAADPENGDPSRLGLRPRPRLELVAVRLDPA